MLSPLQALVMTVHPNRLNAMKLARGATLVELIITIVIISVALSGILTLVNLTNKTSADPLVQHQAIAIAESYLEEIMLLPLIANPDVSVAGDRSTFDNISDYNGLNDTGAKDQNGQPINGLEHYSVAVSISNQTLSAVAMTVITVTVTRPSTQAIVLTGYRANY